MHVTLCDWCVGDHKHTKALYQFELVGLTIHFKQKDEHPWHLCQEHRDELWQLHCSRADLVQT